MRICVFTSGRSDYGLLRPLIELLACELLRPWDFGLGSSIWDMDALLGGCMHLFQEHPPPCVVLLGDRWETFAVATAAHMRRVPIVHIHGGELTEGSLDDAFRHSITHMASMHLVSNEDHARRVRQLGQDPATVHVTGALGVDNALRIGPKEPEGFALACFHPDTMGGDTLAQLEAVIEGLDDYPTVWVGPNADAGNAEIRERLSAFPGYVDDLDPDDFLELLARADFMVGNSSAAIIEAPSLNVPSIDVGDRQKGRMRATSVFHSRPEPDCIRVAVKAVTDPRFREYCKNVVNPYGDGHAAERMQELIVNARFTRKRFHDWGER